MYCKKCGSPLPNDGYICKFCGTMVAKDQIKEQKELIKEHKYDQRLKTEKYGQAKINYQTEEKPKENKFLGIAIIVAVIIFLIILAILLNVN